MTMVPSANSSHVVRITKSRGLVGQMARYEVHRTEVWSFGRSTISYRSNMRSYSTILAGGGATRRSCFGRFSRRWERGSVGRSGGAEGRQEKMKKKNPPRAERGRPQNRLVLRGLRDDTRTNFKGRNYSRRPLS